MDDDEHRDGAADSTAVRVALWRALHTEVDPPPLVLDDQIGLRLVGPGPGWRDRADMDPAATSGFRAAVVARARFVEDLVAEQARNGISQYVILGAGLDTFAQRRPDIARRMRIFEVDRPTAQSWKRRRLVELGLGVPEWLTLVPVDFESGLPWWDQLTAAGFDPGQPAVVASTGVTMYLTRDAIVTTLRRVARLAPGSVLAMDFLLPAELGKPEERSSAQAVDESARASGTPFLSYFGPSEMLGLARESGLRRVEHVSADELTRRYFAERTDRFRPSSAQAFLVATT